MAMAVYYFFVRPRLYKKSESSTDKEAAAGLATEFSPLPSMFLERPR